MMMMLMVFRKNTFCSRTSSLCYILNVSLFGTFFESNSMASLQKLKSVRPNVRSFSSLK